MSNDQRDNLEKQTPSIFRGAERNDLGEVRNALSIDRSAINMQDRMGLTALHIAAADGNKTLVKFLLDQPGCRFDLVDVHGRIPSVLAYMVGRDDIVGLIANAMAEDLRRRFPEIDDNDNGSRDEGAALRTARPPQLPEP